LETFAESKELVENPCYEEQRQNSLFGLNGVVIDAPIMEIIQYMNKLPYCFTLQSCYGHFLYEGRDDPFNIDSLVFLKSIDRVEYRIAYIAFCIECSKIGRRFLDALHEITLIDPENIQLCSPEWFWQRQVNSYALQVEPSRFKHEDKSILDFKEALYIENIRNIFFAKLKELLRKTHG
jgi:hypothetical protein